MAVSNLLGARSVTVIYHAGTPFESLALRNVELDVRAGESLGLIGTTGSGKSTFLQSLAGLIPLSSGACEYGEGFDRAELYRRIGMVFQMPEDQLFEETVFDDVAFGPRQLGWSPEQIRLAVEEALGKMGLDPRAYGRRSPMTLSGGEKRRAALAGILAMAPVVLLLDEPTAGLDCRGQRQLEALVGTLRGQGVTFVIVSHELDFLARVVDRIALFDAGRLVTLGPATEVLGNPEILRGAGLEPPPGVRLLSALKERGFPVRVDRIGPGDVADEVITVLAPRSRRR